MALDIVAILTAAEGKEQAVEELLTNLANGVKDGEPNVTRYKPYKRYDTPPFSHYASRAAHYLCLVTKNQHVS